MKCQSLLLLLTLLHMPAAIAQEYDAETQQILEALQAVDNANSAVKKINSFDKSCACTLDNKPVSEIDFESHEQCGKDRNYLKGAFSSLGELTGTREYKPGENTVPPKCVLYLMRSGLRNLARTADQKAKEELLAYTEAGKNIDELKTKTYNPDPQQFAYCKDETGTPERIGGKPCVTPDYFNVVYNSLSDVADCMGVPMNFVVPKLANESGFHVNAFGPVNDAGIGQFTASALMAVAEDYVEFKTQIESSTKESCKRMRSIPGALVATPAEILTPDAQRCHAIKMPPNPIRSLLYYGMFYKSSKRNAEKAWSRINLESEDMLDQESVDEVMGAADLGPLDKKKLQQMLFVMSYNAGIKAPVRLFKEWMLSRVYDDQQITTKDFNFDFWPPRGFGAVEKEVIAEMNALAKKNGWTDEDLKIAISNEKARRRIIHIGAENRPLTFPEYIYVNYGGNIYISAVKAQAKSLDKTFGEGVCAESKLLAL